MQLTELAEGMGEQIWERVLAKTGDELEALELLAKEKVKVCVIDLSSLTMQSLSGVEVGAEIALVKSEILDWRFVGASTLRRAIEEALKEVLEIAGKVALGVLKAAI